MKNKHKNAFTLIEILVVIAIIGIIAALILVVVSTLKNKARKARVQSDLDEFVKVVIMAQGETGKFLKDITGSPCSDCGWCPPISVGVTCRERDLRNIPESDGCFKCWKQALTKIQNNSGGAIELNINKLLRDPWGSPYCLDENEGEWNWWDTICSAGPDGFYSSTDPNLNNDNICFKIPYAKK